MGNDNNISVSGLSIAICPVGLIPLPVTHFSAESDLFKCNDIDSLELKKAADASISYFTKNVTYEYTLTLSPSYPLLYDLLNIAEAQTKVSTAVPIIHKWSIIVFNRVNGMICFIKDAYLKNYTSGQTYGNEKLADWNFTFITGERSFNIKIPL